MLASMKLICPGQQPYLAWKGGNRSVNSRIICVAECEFSDLLMIVGTIVHYWLISEDTSGFVDV